MWIPARHAEGKKVKYVSGSPDKADKGKFRKKTGMKSRNKRISDEGGCRKMERSMKLDKITFRDLLLS